MRLRITFAKTEAMRYTGHLDLYRAWERTLRRADLPLAYSQGFNPRPKLQLACTLPLGFTSQCELLDAWLEGDQLAKDEIELSLRQAVPPGIQVLSLVEIDPLAPTLQTQIISAEYISTLLASIADLESKVKTLLASPTLLRQRRGKTYDLRPLVEALSILTPDEADDLRLFMRLTAQEARTGRPEEVLSALGIPSNFARIHRTRIIL